MATSTLSKLSAAAIAAATLFTVGCTPPGTNDGVSSGSSSSKLTLIKSSSSSSSSSISSTSSSSSRSSSSRSSSSSKSSTSSTSSRSSTQSQNSAAPQLSVTVQNDREVAHPGEEVAWMITVQNTSAAAVKDMRVAWSFSPLQQTVLQSDGTVFPDRIEWMVPGLEPGQRVALRIRAKLSQQLQGGEIVGGSAAVTLKSNSYTVSSVGELHIVRELPPTGGGEYTGSYEDPYRFLTPVK